MEIAIFLYIYRIWLIIVFFAFKLKYNGYIALLKNFLSKGININFLIYKY